MGKGKHLMCRICVAVLLFVTVPAETAWIVNGAMASQLLPLEEESERFRSFEVTTKELQRADGFTEASCRRLALKYLFAREGRVPLAFSLQVDKNVREGYTDAFATVLSDVKCFPVAYDGTGGETVSYENSWGTARNYGGDRRHEGVDLMTSNNVPGYFPAVSICEGVVEKIGWLELGGYRIGIRSEHGMYAYYAHLDSYADGLEAGDKVKSGQILGYVGNTGYGEEGTKGKFDVHLHFGIYIDIGGKETSINPYEILNYLEG